MLYYRKVHFIFSSFYLLEVLLEKLVQVVTTSLHYTYRTHLITKAVEEELKMIEKNDKWEMVESPQHKQPIAVKWVYINRLNANGSIGNYTVGLVVKGCAYVFGGRLFKKICF